MDVPLATFFYLEKYENLTLNRPWAGWFPIISVILINGSKAFGIGSINNMLQVINTQYLIDSSFVYVLKIE